jgi:CRP-like cAMP-binding protein
MGRPLLVGGSTLPCRGPRWQKRTVETFGRYELIEKIAVGGMAEILLARSDSIGGLDRPCVIKRIRESYSADLQFVSMFIDEARITIGLDHENIVRLFDFGQHEGQYYMAMEYVDGTDLAILMRHHREKAKLITPEAAAYICAEALRGLHHAHSKVDHEGNKLEIVHRDVSPQNILLGIQATVKITDFGIAAAKNKLTLTSPGTVLGKSAYMAPEQALGETVDGRCDVWAMGVILHELISGQRLFAAENDARTLTRVFEAAIMPMSEIRPGVDTALDSIALRALARERDKRYQSAEAMLADLDAWLVEHPFSADALSALIDKVAWADETVSVRPALSERGLARDPAEAEAEAATVLKGAPFDDDEEVKALLAQLHKEPSLWTMVALADRYAKLGAIPDAVAGYRCAAAVFAHKGLLVQAICAYDGARAHLTNDEVFDDFIRLGDLRPRKKQELDELIQGFGADRPYKLLEGAGRLDLGRQRPPSHRDPTPLFGYLAPREFAQLAEAVKVRRIGVGSVVIDEGETGDSLFAIGHGRLVVYTKPSADAEQLQNAIADVTSRAAAGIPISISQEGLVTPERVYLSALADGDYFGEFSFLTGRPRSASVEAITDCRVIEMGQAVVDSIFDVEPGFTEPLLRFYKERVVELLMAKSPVFCLLRPADRRTLLEKAALVDFADGELIVSEGEKPGALYFIKRGEVEIYRTDASGLSIFINKLGQGEFFGEIAAITGEARTVNVRAMGDVSLFRVGRDELLDVVEREPKLKKLFTRMIEDRTAQTAEAVDEHQRIFYGT